METTAPEPGSDVVGQDAVSGAAVEGGKVSRPVTINDH